MSKQKFDISLPGLYKEKWRKAYRTDADDSPRLSSYQAPSKEPIPFIYKNLNFSGGQAVDTAEYPFFGLWSNEALNHKPQTITVYGYLRGEYYLQQRTAFIDALMIPTSDDTPGFFDHPLWGRFKVVVENYNISETANENGQCEISLTLKRAGVSLENRARVLSPQNFLKPEDVALAAIVKFADTKADSVTLLQAFGFIKTQLLNIISKIQAAETAINSVVNEVNSISNLIAQGVQAPIQLAQAAANAVFSIASAAISIKDSAQPVKKYFSGKKAEKNTVMDFFSAATYTFPIKTETVKQEEAKKESENLYRTLSLCASAKLLMQMDDTTYTKMAAYWTLYKKLENSINLENLDVYKNISELRALVSETLRNSALTNELKRSIEKPVPLLFLAHHLGCEDEKLREMNFIEDSLLVSGEVTYA